MTSADLAGLRVLAFCDYYSVRSAGGSERVARETYERLAVAGADITLVSACPPPLMEDEPDSRVRVVKTPSLDASRLVGAQLAMGRHYRSVARRAYDELRPQVIHAQGLHFHGSVVAARLAARTSTPLVTTAHLGGPERLPAAARTAAMVFEHGVSRYILKRSTHVIAVSESVAAHVARLHSRAKVTVVPNGVDHDTFYPADASEPIAKTAVPVIGFVGRLIANKGPDVFVAALSELHRREIAFSAVVIGAGPLEAKLHRSVEESGFADRVTFAGRVTDVAERLRRLDVVVRPSTTEGMPLTVLEAMATGVCVIASDIDGNRGLITHGVNGLLFPAGDVHALADRLTDVLSDSTARLRMARAGRTAAMAHSWDACAAGTGEVLAQTARRPS